MTKKQVKIRKRHGVFGKVSEKQIKRFTPKFQQKQRVSKEVTRSHATVFIRNLPFSATSQDLLELISKLVKPERVFVVNDPVTHASKGYAFVQLLSGIIVFNSLGISV